MEVVKDLCNKCAVMDAGKVVEAGSTLEIFANPKKELTREFVETSTNVSETIEEVKQNIGILKENELLVKLNYIGDSTTEPIINDLYAKYGITTNVLAGNIEFITGIPVGNLIVTMAGDTEALANIGNYLTDNNVSAEILGGKDGVF